MQGVSQRTALWQRESEGCTCCGSAGGEGGGHVCGFAINITFRKNFTLVLYFLEKHHHDR